MCRQQRLDQQRVAQQREQRTKVGKREQSVGIGADVGARIPGLHQRSGGGQDEVGQADAGGKQAEDAQCRVIAAGGLP